MVQTGVATATQGTATLFTTTDSIGSTAEAKLLSYLDASPSTSKVNCSFQSLKINNIFIEKLTFNYLWCAGFSQEEIEQKSSK